MDFNAIAAKQADFGQRKARALARLSKIIEEECAFHQSLIPAVNLSPEVEAQSVAPKDRR